MAEKEMEWEALDIEGVMDLLGQCSHRVRREWGYLFEYEDLWSEGAIILAQPGLVRGALDEESGGSMGRLHHILWQDLTNLSDKWHRKVKQNVSRDALLVEVVDG